MTSLDRVTCVPRRGFLRHLLKTTAGGALLSPLMAGGVLAREALKKSESPNDAWQIGCYTRPWGQFDYRVALDAIAEAGFKYAGLMTTKAPKGNLVISTATTAEEAARVGEEAKQRGLSIPSVYGGDFGVGKSLQTGIEGLRRLIDNCVAAGAKTLMAGGIGAPRLYGDYYKTIAECCDYAAEKGVGIVLKPHGGLNATGPQCRKAIELVGHGSFSLWYDPGNILYYSDGDLNPVDDAATVDGIVTGMCVKDFTMSITDGKVAKNVALAPGSGRVDFPGVMALLRKGGFTAGPLIIETLAPGDRKTLLAGAKRARRFVESLVGME